MMTSVDYVPCKKLEIRYPDARHASLGEVMPHVDDMRIIVLLNDAYFDEKRVQSIQELKNLVGIDSLAKLKADITLTEGKKLLPSSLINGLSGDFKSLNIERDDCGHRECWKMDFSYIAGSLLEPFDDPVGVFTIVPENEGWLIHTRDDEPWIYCLLPDHLAQRLIENEPDIAEEVENSFPYS